MHGTYIIGDQRNTRITARWLGCTSPCWIVLASPSSSSSDLERRAQRREGPLLVRLPLVQRVQAVHHDDHHLQLFRIGHTQENYVSIIREYLREYLKKFDSFRAPDRSSPRFQNQGTAGWKEGGQERWRCGVIFLAGKVGEKNSAKLVFEKSGKKRTAQS